MTPPKFEFVIGYIVGGEQRTLRIAPAVAVLAALTVVSVALADKKQPPLEVIQASAGPVPDPPAANTLTAPGNPHGEEEAVITPLNVRDPSTLVMAPAVLTQLPAAEPAAPEQSKPRASEPACEDPYPGLKALPLKL